LVRKGSSYGQRGNVQQVTEDWEGLLDVQNAFLTV